jgi:hypothetical protein
MALRILVTALAALAVSAPAAHAGKIELTGPNQITFTAYPGEENFVNVNWGNVGAPPDFIPKLSDFVRPDPGPGCITDDLGSYCPAAGPNPTFIVHLGDGNDTGKSTNDHAAGHHVEIYGEDGNDDLYSHGGSDLLDGGAGNDRLEPDEDDAGPGDVVVGGPGVDDLWVATALGANGPVTASLNGAADDGYPGEADNYAADIENLQGISTSPPIHFVGTDGPNTVQMRSESADVLSGMGGDDIIDGADGNDIIDGGDGNDTIYGGGNDDQIKGGPGLDSLSGEGSASGFFISIAGNDIIDARDGVREQLNCGPGADTAIVDELDVVPQDPGSLCEAVDRSAASGGGGGGGSTKVPVPKVRSSRLSVKSGRVSVSLSCTDACSGKLTLKTASKVKLGSKKAVVTLGSASYRIAAGKKATIKVKLSSNGKRLMRKVSKVRVKLTAAPKSGKAASRTLTLKG